MRDRFAGFIVGLLLALGIASAQSATTNSGTLTVTTSTCNIDTVSKDMVCVLPYTLTSNGANILARILRIPGNNGPILDAFGFQVAATVPAAISTARDSLITGLSSTLSTGAAGGKLDVTQ